MRTQSLLTTTALLIAMTACGGSGGGSGGGTTSPTTPTIPSPPGGGSGGSGTPGIIGSGPPVVMGIPGGAATLFVSTTGNDNNAGTQSAPFRTLQKAADTALPGDVIEVLDGTYNLSSQVLINVQGTQNSPIIIRSSTGQAIFDGSAMSGSASSRDALMVENSEHLIIHGLQVRNAPRSGIRVSLGSFVTVQACRTGPNGRWGIFTDYVDDMQILGNDCFESGTEHGIYFSNSGDRVVIRGNFCHDNAASGLQINADPALPGDGITSNAIIEDNVCARNGRLGGAAINLASVRDSTIRNNLCYDNLASGIVLWDDGFSPNFGSKNNTVMHNTIVFKSGEGRHCLVMRNGSTGNNIQNNIFVGGRRGAYEITTDSLPGFVNDFNIITSVDGWPIATDDTTGITYNLASWRNFTGGAANSVDLLPTFVDRANNDFHLATSSAGQAAGTLLGLSDDLLGDTRSGSNPDLGALEN